LNRKDTLNETLNDTTTETLKNTLHETLHEIFKQSSGEQHERLKHQNVANTMQMNSSNAKI
jgi:hypothetical protein